jgi:hypothetical protein
LAATASFSRTEKPGRDVDLARLSEAVTASRNSLEFFRDQRLRIARLVAGGHWSEEAGRSIQPVNLLWNYQNVISRNLVAKNPRVLLTTPVKGDKPAVSSMQAWANRKVAQSRLAETFRRAVIDALYSTGIVQVALTTPAESMAMNWQAGGGEAFAARISLDNWAHDDHAKELAESAFLGHMLRLPLEAVKDSKHYSATRNKLVPQDDRRYHGSTGDEKARALGRSDQGYATEFEDMVTVWQVYLPRRRLVLTLAAGEDEQIVTDWEPLAAQEWVGPDSGPYHFLQYGVVPDNAMGLGPMLNLVDLHEAANDAFRKLMRQAARLKQVGLVADDEEGAQRIIDAKDGEVVRVARPEGFAEVVRGGPNNELFVFFQACQTIFDAMAGNLSLLSGRAPASPTASQDRMLNANASAGVSDLQETTTTFVSDVFRALCWYWWHDPFTTMTTTYQVPGLPDISRERRLRPEQRTRSKWADIDVRVDPYSMQFSTPQAKLANLRQVMQGVLMPVMPLLEQQGLVVNFDKYLEFEAVYGDMPELPEIVSMQEPPVADGAQGAEQPSMGAVPTERRYVRENRSERTQGGMDQLLANAMAGKSSGGNPTQSAPKPFGG